MAKYNDGMCHEGSFRGRSNVDLKLIKCEDKIFILSILQSYVLHWYHTYLFHTGMDIMEAIICQHLFWAGIRNALWKEVTNCDTFQHTKRSNIEYG